MTISLDALAVLDAIDRRGSFAAAAVELDRVPSAITYTIRTLEDTLDVLLFDRRGHRAQLTPAGRTLLEDGRRLLAAANETEARVRRVATGWESELRVAVDVLIPWSRIFPLVAAFYVECAVRQSAHTQLRLSREVLGGSWDALAESRADFVIGAPGEPPSGAAYKLRAMAEMTSLFVVAPRHLLAQAREPLSEPDIARHRAVVAADSSRHLAPRSIGILAGQDTLTVPDLEAKLAAQMAGLGCGYLPAPVAAADITAGRLVIKATDVPRTSARVSAAWRTLRPGNALAWWIEAVTRTDWSFLAMAPTSSAASPAPAAAKGKRKTARAPT